MGKGMFVHKSSIVTDEDVRRDPDPNRRNEYVEVLVLGEGRCRQRRIEELSPDVAESMKHVNRSIMQLAESQDNMVDLLKLFIGRRKLKKPGEK